MTSRVAIADALRSAAILLVLANHLAIGAAITVGGHRADYAFLGVIGVDCFLVLSGFLLGGLVLALGLRALVFARMPHDLYQSFATTAVYARNVVGVGGDFALGTAVALITTQARRPARWSAAGILACGRALLAFVCRIRGVDSASFAVQVSYDTLGGLGIAFVLYGLIEGAVPPIVALASLPAVTALAELAYATYLFHYPIIDYVRSAPLPGAVESATRAVVFALVVLAATFACAWLAHRFVERPFLAVRDRNRETIPTLP